MIYCDLAHLQKVYPEITVSDVMPFIGTILLQDDADGKGPYIKIWNYSQPEPTQDQINALS